MSVMATYGFNKTLITSCQVNYKAFTG